MKIQNNSENTIIFADASNKIITIPAGKSSRDIFINRGTFEKAILMYSSDEVKAYPTNGSEKLIIKDYYQYELKDDPNPDNEDPLA